MHDNLIQSIKDAWTKIAPTLANNPHELARRRPVYRPFRGQPKYRGWRWICPGCRRETLRLKLTSVHVWIHRIYQRHHVRTRQELRQALAATQAHTAKTAG